MNHTLISFAEKYEEEERKKKEDSELDCSYTTAVAN